MRFGYTGRGASWAPTGLPSKDNLFWVTLNVTKIYSTTFAVDKEVEKHKERLFPNCSLVLWKGLVELSLAKDQKCQKLTFDSETAFLSEQRTPINSNIWTHDLLNM